MRLIGGVVPVDSRYNCSGKIFGSRSQVSAMSDRELRKVLKRVDKQRVSMILSIERAGVRPVHVIEFAIPDDEPFMCGLLSCEFRGWVERFGEEVPIRDTTTGKERIGNTFRITQAGRSVLDRTQTIANVALIVAIVSLLTSNAASM